MNKRETWETLKKQDSETANFLLEMAEAFGKLENVKIVGLDNDSRETKENDNDR